MVLGYLALTVAALFTGAAFCINFAEQPARLRLDDRGLLTQWKPAYKRGFVMQASLAVLGFLFGAAAWWQTGVMGFLAGGLLMLSNWPYTLIVLMPTNNALMASDPAKADAKTRVLIQKWNWLHAARTALGALAVLSFLVALTWQT